MIHNVTAYESCFEVLDNGTGKPVSMVLEGTEFEDDDVIYFRLHDENTGKYLGQMMARRITMAIRSREGLEEGCSILQLQ